MLFIYDRLEAVVMEDVVAVAGKRWACHEIISSKAKASATIDAKVNANDNNFLM